jgi:hypothetical protein
VAGIDDRPRKVVYFGFTLSGWLGRDISGLLLVSPTTQVRSSSLLRMFSYSFMLQGLFSCLNEVIFLVIFLNLILTQVCEYLYYAQMAWSGLLLVSPNFHPTTPSYANAVFITLQHNMHHP